MYIIEKKEKVKIDDVDKVEQFMIVDEISKFDYINKGIVIFIIIMVIVMILIYIFYKDKPVTDTRVSSEGVNLYTPDTSISTAIPQSPIILPPARISSPRSSLRKSKKNR